MKPGYLGITEDLLDARSLYLTVNTTTVYCGMEIDVKNGPVVVALPPDVLGPSNDAFFRHVADFGLVGPHKGKETNWIKIVPGRGWWVWFRFYGPTEAFFDKSWQLPDFERVD